MNIASTKKTRTIELKMPSFIGGVEAELSEAVMSPTKARMCFNFAFDKGSLKTGLGIDFVKVLNGLWPAEGQERFVDVHLPTTFHPVVAYHYKHYDANDNFKKAHKLVFISKEHKIMQMQIPNFKGGLFDSYEQTMEIVNFPKNVLNYRLKDRDVLIMTFENDCMQIYDGSEPEATRLKRIEDAPPIVSMCLHYERLFAIVYGKRNAVWFSKELDPTEWDVSLDKAGYIEMIDERGECTKVISFNGYVYVFREYGIARLTAYADQTEFSVTQLYTTSGRIFEETVTVCGDKIMFLAEDGLYLFDGANTRKINLGIEDLIDKTKYKFARSAYCNGKYYLACFLNYNDDEKIDTEILSDEVVNNTMMTIDINESILTIYRGFDIAFFNVINETDYSQLICCHNGFRDGQIGEIIENDGCSYWWKLKKKWVSPKFNFGYPDKDKVLTKFSIKVSDETKVIFETEKEKRSIILQGKNDWQTIRTCVRGKEFSFIIETEKAIIQIEPPKFSFKLIE